MILSYGEILVDFIGKDNGGVLSYERYAGGAPFNVACAAAKAGGNAGFAGAVGDDLIGRFLNDFAHKQGLASVDITVRPDANTTLAFVELDAGGERSFCFYRKNTADYKMDYGSLEKVESADIVHLGSLMLSMPEGVDFARELVKTVKAAGKKLSFDINYRDDIFPCKEAAKTVFGEFADAADIVKYSAEELELFTGEKRLDGLDKVAKPGKLVCVTLGGAGSAYALGEKRGTVSSVPVKVVDTTGAGDAFYGALLSRLDGKELKNLKKAELDAAFKFANVAGACATAARGAIAALPSLEEIRKYL